MIVYVYTRLFMCILDEYSEDDEEFGIDEVTAHATGKIGAKKLRRMQAKAEKKALREVLIYKYFYYLLWYNYSKKNHLEKTGKGVKLNVKKVGRHKRKKERNKKS